jgi:large subunit ribosomal protein L33
MSNVIAQEPQLLVEQQVQAELTRRELRGHLLILRYHSQYLNPLPRHRMAKSGRVQVKLRSTESHAMYVTTKNPRTMPQRMEKRKYDPHVKRHVLFKESK